MGEKVIATKVWRSKPTKASSPFTKPNKHKTIKCNYKSQQEIAKFEASFGIVIS